MATNWDEIKRLAADFQQAQIGSSLQRLSEKNCVEIVNKLIEKELLDVLYTVDGKEYVTPDHVLREIQDELFASGGRIHLSNLAEALRLDYNCVEAKASELVKTETDIQLTLGKLLNRSYLDGISEDINDKLQQTGVIFISDLVKQYDLLPDILHKMVTSRLGTIIHGKPDPSNPHVIYTRAAVKQYMARIRGALLATTKPLILNAVISRYNLQDRLFFMALNELASTGQLPGSFSDGRHNKSSSFVPSIHTEAKNSLIHSFYKLNNYFEFGNMIRAGIGDPQAFIRKNYDAKTLTFLRSCAINDVMVEQIVVNVEDQMANSFWLDVMESACPSFFSVSDVKQMLPMILNNSKELKDVQVFLDTILVKNDVIKGAPQLFDVKMKAKAEEAVQLGHVTWDNIIGDATGDSGGSRSGHVDAKKERKEERRKKAASSGKSGGGTQGRESKTKSTKKKYMKGGSGGGGDSDDEEASAGGRDGVKSAKHDLRFLSLREIADVLKRWDVLEDCPEELCTTLAELLENPLNEKFKEMARALYHATSGSQSSLRKSHADIQDKVSGLASNVYLFVKGIKLFDDDLQVQLHKHLLKTLCLDITNLLFTYVAQDRSSLNADQDSPMTPEMRTKLLPKFPKEYHEAFNKLNSTLNGKTVDDFLAALDAVLGPSVCDIMLKKHDKKKDKQVFANHRQMLLQQLSEVSEPALVLHLTVLVLFQNFTQHMLHASGKFVPQILAFLEQHLPVEVHQLLLGYQDLVIRHLTTKDDPQEQMANQVKLKDMMPSIKETAVNTKNAKK